MECVEAWSHAHGMMPRDRKRPPNQSAENALPNGKWNNVAIAGKEPCHGDSPDESERNQHGIRPMNRGKDCAGEQRGSRRGARRSEKPVRQVGIQPNLLEQAKGHIPKKMLRSEEHTSELQSQSNLVCRLLLE